MKKWFPLIILSMAQFLMVLDTSVMNVSISQLVDDFQTNVSQIQAAITFYALVMAAFMITGGKLGDVLGRRRTFAIGMAIYALGSGITSISRTVPVLVLGWSVLEGIGAALVLPAMVALLAGSYEGKDRATAFGVLGGVAGAGFAVGPLIGGWVTTYLTWRLVFVGEVIIAIVILLGLRVVEAAPKTEENNKINWSGAVMSGIGLGLIVYGVLRSSKWGIIRPINSPIAPLGLALTPFVIFIGIIVLNFFATDQKRREESGQYPLIHWSLFKNSQLKSGLSMLLMQNMILSGVFFSVPLYLQLTIGLSAFETGLRLFPASVALLLSSMLGSQLANKLSPKLVIRIALTILFVGIIILLSAIEPELESIEFATAMAMLGTGVGLMFSLLGYLTQSAVSDKDRSEVGALANTGTQLGTALGTAIIGAIVISSLAISFSSEISGDDRISEQVEQAIDVRLAEGVTFVSAEQLESAIRTSDVDDELVDAIIEDYEVSQLMAIRYALFAAAVIVIWAFFISKKLPDKPLVT
ncbi:MAG: MFS transporter [Alkalibacterium sp.]|nr:MFS transporter [Alkalibacterium sp.]TVP90240.1 MAG: MFS transporter [Alkalibacterium sp.]